MASKTPKFDEALDNIFSELKPHARVCENKDFSPHCKGEFAIEKEDIEMLKLLRVPPPKLCFHCRSQRRMALSPSLLKFYKKDDAANPGKQVISSFHPKSPFKVFNSEHYHNPNAWDGLEYGREHDLNRPFFDQFYDLLVDVPHFAVPHYAAGMENSEYTVSSGWLKNCYMSAILGWCEDVNYSVWALYSKDCFDCLGIDHSEECYENVVNNKCSRCFFVQQCFECINCTLCFDCRNCQDCFGCTNLRNKQYCFFNEQLSKEEYQAKMEEIRLGDRSVLEEYIAKFEKQKEKALHLASYQKMCDGCVGHQIGQSKNCHYLFWALQCENVRYASDAAGIKDSMDLTSVGMDVERSYNTLETLKTYEVKCCNFVGESSQMEYCYECFDCQNCFGCVGLKKKKFCIFNVQYSEEEYWNRLDEIKTKMLADGVYGEYMPLDKAMYPYGDTFALPNYLLTEEEGEKLGVVSYADDVGSDQGKLLTKEKVPVDIRDVTDDILETGIKCEVSGKPFRILRSELEFYRKHDLPIPTKHPHVRLMERFTKRDPVRLWERQCMCDYDIYKNTGKHGHHLEGRCQNKFQTAYAPERKEIVYCETCYNAEVV